MMTPRQMTLFRQVYFANANYPGMPFLVDGPRRGKVALQMVGEGYLANKGKVGSPFPLGYACYVTRKGVRAYNAAVRRKIVSQTETA